MKSLKLPKICACKKPIIGIEYQVKLVTVCEECYTKARAAKRGT